MTDVTVLMAIHNAMPHLPAAIESIRGQTLEDWRMVVVDDGSSDESAEYVEQLGDGRIEIIRQINRGLGAALNHGLQFCQTDLVARMDGDDICHPSRFEKQVEFLRSHPDVGCVGTQIERMGSRRSKGNSAIATEHEAIYSGIVRGINQMYHPTIMVRTELMKAIGGYWEHPRGEEWDLFLRLGERMQLANLNEVLFSYRIHTGSMTGQSVDNIRTWIDYACECARRRGEGLPEIGHDEFVRQLRDAGWVHRLGRACDMHGRTQYRIGLGERLGERPLRGSMRIAYSALWSPSLCLGRIRREAGRIFRRQDQPICDAEPSLGPDLDSGVVNEAGSHAAKEFVASSKANASPLHFGHRPHGDAPVPHSGEVVDPETNGSPRSIPLLGLPVHQVTMQETVDWIFDKISMREGGWVLTPNVDILRNWNRDSEFRELTRAVTLCVADGMPLVWASRLAGTPLPQRINGTNLTRRLIADAGTRNASIFFLGGAAGTADRLASRMKTQHPELQIAGTHCPPLGFEDDEEEMNRLREAVVGSEADLVFVALGSPKQEKLIGQMRSLMPATWWLGVGATFDFLSGRIPRAPGWMQHCGLEWAHRLSKEPRRLAQRYLVDDLPFACGMMIRCAAGRVRDRSSVAIERGNQS